MGISCNKSALSVQRKAVKKDRAKFGSSVSCLQCVRPHQGWWYPEEYGISNSNRKNTGHVDPSFSSEWLVGGATLQFAKTGNILFRDDLVRVRDTATHNFGL